MRVGQLVRISVASQPDMTFEGKVARINPSVDPVSRTFQVETLVPNDRRLLRPGGFAKATIVTDSAAKAAVVPDRVDRPLRRRDQALPRRGRQGPRDQRHLTRVEGKGWVEVASKSLPPPASVVTTGQTQLADRTPVDDPQPSRRQSAVGSRQVASRQSAVGRSASRTSQLVH